MKSKSLSLLTLGILSLLVFTAFASAVSVNPTSLTFSPFETTGTFSVINDGDEALILTSPIIIEDNQDTPNQVTITLNDTSIVADTTETITATLGTIPSDFSLGTFSTTYTVSPGVTLELVLENTPNNDYEDNEDLSLDLEVSVEKGLGEDTEWYLMDEITAEIEVSTDEDMENIVVEWGLYDAQDGKWIIDGEEDDFNLDDESETVTINFKLDEDVIDEINPDSNDYVFYAWVTGENTDTDEKTSTYESVDIDLQIEDDLAVLSNVGMLEVVPCGSEVQITADVWNIGVDKQNDISVVVYNKELGIDKKIEIGDIKSLKSSDFELTISLPEEAEAKEYDLKFSVYSDDDLYESNNEDEDASVYIQSFKIEGSCSVAPTVLVSAILESEKAIAGKELVVKTIIENTGSKTSTFNIGLSDYSEWASLENVDKTSVTLDAGESEEVLIKLKINQDSLGDKKFNVVLTEDGKTLTQPVSVNVEKSAGFSLTGMFSGIAGNNWYLWGIGALNVLLVLVIIVVAVKVSKKKE